MAANVFELQQEINDAIATELEAQAHRMRREAKASVAVGTTYSPVCARECEIQATKLERRAAKLRRAK